MDAVRASVLDGVASLDSTTLIRLPAHLRARSCRQPHSRTSPELRALISATVAGGQRRVTEHFSPGWRQLGRRLASIPSVSSFVEAPRRAAAEPPSTFT